MRITRATRLETEDYLNTTFGNRGFPTCPVCLNDDYDQLHVYREGNHRRFACCSDCQPETAALYTQPKIGTKAAVHLDWCVRVRCLTRMMRSAHPGTTPGLWEYFTSPGAAQRIGDYVAGR